MSQLNRVIRRGAVVGLVAAAASVTVACAATPAIAAAGPAAETNPLQIPLPNPLGDGSGSLQIPNPLGDGSGSLGCIMFAYNLGPFGPLGPWGPYGPLHDKPHPACVGGGPDFNK